MIRRFFSHEEQIRKTALAAGKDGDFMRLLTANPDWVSEDPDHIFNKAHCVFAEKSPLLFPTLCAFSQIAKEVTVHRYDPSISLFAGMDNHRVIYNIRFKTADWVDGDKEVCAIHSGEIEARQDSVTGLITLSIEKPGIQKLLRENYASMKESYEFAKTSVQPAYGSPEMLNMLQNIITARVSERGPLKFPWGGIVPGRADPEVI